MCDFCHGNCRSCNKNDSTINCWTCCNTFCDKCRLPTNIYIDQIAKNVLGESEDEMDTNDEKYRQIAWPDVGYICNTCYTLKRAENMMRIMNGLLIRMHNRSIRVNPG